MKAVAMKNQQKASAVKERQLAKKEQQIDAMANEVVV